MKSKHFFVLVVLATSLLIGCSNNKTNPVIEGSTNTLVNSDSARVSGVPCDIQLSGIHFTKAINGADTLIDIEYNDKIAFRVGEKKDYFCDPNNNLLSNKTAPILLAKVDNTKPFTFTAKVTPKFTEEGLYDAGVFYIYVNDNFWQKHCFEQDERGNHRIVTVRTIGTSDDNNHDVVNSPSVYMKISSDTHTVASYYSLDKENWQMVRLYKNNYPSEIWLGVSAQCPKAKNSMSYFEEINLVQTSVSDFRLGN